MSPGVRCALLLAAFIPASVLAGPAGEPVPPGWHEDGLPILRFQKHAARERAWILTREGVLAFDFRSRQTSALAKLPQWTWASEAFVCLPDLAVGPKGEAVVTSNVVPELWRVDPATLAVTRHELVLDPDTRMDVGFTGLIYSARHEVFFGVSESGGLWRIDPLLRRAQKIELSAPLYGACGLALASGRNRFTRFCVAGPGGGWTVNLAPDHRAGYVLRQPCKAVNTGTDAPSILDGVGL